MVEKIKAEGKTILLTTHYMEEAEILCDEVAIMDHGRIIARDTPAKLLNKNFDGVFVKLPWKEELELPQGLSENVSRKDDHIEIHSRDVDGTLHSLIHNGVHLNGLSIHSPNLEDLFLKLTGTSLRQ